MDRGSKVLHEALLKDAGERQIPILPPAGAPNPQEIVVYPPAEKGLAFEAYDPKDEESLIHFIEPVKMSVFKVAFFVFISLTVLPLLLVKWSVRIKKALLYTTCDILLATHLLITGPHEDYEMVNLENVVITEKGGAQREVKKFEYRFFPYFYDEDLKKVVPIKLNCARTYVNIHEELSKGMRSQTDVENNQRKFGKCLIEVPYKGVGGILLEAVLTPFYLFQVASVTLWMCDTYYYYAGAILIMTIISIVAEVVETRRNLLAVRAMAMFECEVNVLRPSVTGSLKSPVIANAASVSEGPQFAIKSSAELVPGDIIEIPSSMRMPCDCALLSGSCIVNEAMLTGESIPVLKTALPYINEIYNPDDDKKYTLYSGTEVIQSRPAGDAKVCALVVRTGFCTVKGGLVRFILYPKPSKFAFYNDSYKFIALMFAMSIIGMIVQFCTVSGVLIEVMVKKCLNLITITVPPALPACMSIGVSFALSRLKEKGIFCIAPQRVNMAGKITVFCFDKTGTLTEEGLSVYGFRVSTMVSETQSVFNRFHTTIKGFQNPLMFSDPEFFEGHKEEAKTHFVECMAACHGLTKVNNKMIGDPLDIEMFNSTHWVLDEPEVGGEDPQDMIGAFVMPNLEQKNYDWATNEKAVRPYQLGIIRRFDFSSKLQRMSVIIQNMRDQKYRLYIKGSPEKIRELSKPETLPGNFMEILANYTQQGCRVLALGTRSLNINYQQCQRVNREIIEKKITFLGFLILQNKLKDVTPMVINKLQDAGIRTVMVTGDNPYTAISVARECGMIPFHHTIFLGEVIEESKNKKRIQWNCIEKNKDDNEEDEKPKDAVEEEKEVELDADHAPQKDEKKEDEGSNIVEYFPRQIADTLTLQLDKMTKSIRQSKASVVKEKRRSVLSDEDDEADQEGAIAKYPWEEPGLPYSLAMTGKAFELMLKSDPNAIHPKTKEIMDRCAIFARMSPDGKAALVEAFQSQGHLAGMCGDGANDCVALKAADVGVSLSEAEASIAAPFTSKTPDISCIIKLLREGRAALATSFQCFKYMALYSMVQFVSVSILYTKRIDLTDNQYLFIDLFLIVPLAITMSWTKAAKGLSKEQPATSLFSLPVLCSILGQVAIQCAVQLFFIWWLLGGGYDHYEPPPKYDPENQNAYWQKMSHLNTCVYMISSIQYIATAIAFSVGKPFRQPIYSNIFFTLNVIVILVVNYYIILYPADWVRWLMDLMYDIDDNDNEKPGTGYSTLKKDSVLILIALITALNTAFTYFYESFVIAGITALANKKQKKNEGK